MTSLLASAGSRGGREFHTPFESFTITYQRFHAKRPSQATYMSQEVHIYMSQLTAAGGKGVHGQTQLNAHRAPRPQRSPPGAWAKPAAARALCPASGPVGY